MHVDVISVKRCGRTQCGLGRLYGSPDISVMGAPFERVTVTEPEETLIDGMVRVDIEN